MQGNSSCRDVTGGEGDPVRYNLDGCAYNSGACGSSIEHFPLAADSAFWATCADGATSCDQAEVIYVVYRVYNAKTTLGINDVSFSPYPPFDEYNADPQRFAIAIPVADIEAADAVVQQCPEKNQVLRGAAADGTPNCVCAPGFATVDLDGDGVANECQPEDKNCRDNTYAVGIYKNGSMVCEPRGVPICWVIVNCEPAEASAGSCNCRRRFGYDSRREVWIRRAQLGACTVTSGKKGGNTVECDNSSVECCAWPDK
jgi:hypothetical protein